MPALLPFALALLVSDQTGWESRSGNARTAPAEVHPNVVETLNDAIDAQAKRDYQLSLALLHGVIYQGGVKVAVDSRYPAPNAAAKEGIGRALKAWEDALGSDDPIRLVSDNDAPEIRIQFVDKVPRSGHDALGLIELKKEYRWNRSRYETIVSGTIYIQTHFERSPLDAIQFSEVIAHELGHLLGLEDMPNTGQLMGPMLLEKPVVQPNRREVGAVQFVRNQARKQWNSVLDSMQKDPVGIGEIQDFRTETQYLASCTGERCPNLRNVLYKRT